MKTIWDWIKKHLVKSILILVGILLALIIPPFVVHWMFKTPAHNSFFEQTWGPGDLMTYIAGFEAFFASVAIGLFALKNSEKAVEVTRSGNSISKRLLTLEERQEKIERIPYVYLKEIICNSVVTYADMPAQLSIYFADFSDKSCLKEEYFYIKLSIVNVSKICSYIHFIEFSIQNALSEVYLCSHLLSHLGNILLAPNEFYNFNVFVSKALLESNEKIKCFVSVDATNHFEEIYRQFLFFNISIVDSTEIKVSLEKHRLTPWEAYDNGETNC
jgi:hypothetical protein